MTTSPRTVRSLLLFRMLLGFAELYFVEGKGTISLNDFRKRFVPKANFDSVYRNTETLIELGIIRKVSDLSSRAVSFQVADSDQLAARVGELAEDFDFRRADHVVAITRTAQITRAIMAQADEPVIAER